MLKQITTASISVALLSGCGDDVGNVDIPLGLLKEPYKFARSGEQAVYTIRQVVPGEGGIVISIHTRHSFESGWNFTRRAFRCEKGETRTFATAGTYKGLEKYDPDPRWGGLVRGSSAYYVGQKACSVAGRNFGA